jgi:hypothetical protein
MDQATLATSIAELTGTLRPTDGTTEADLEHGRLLLAQALRSGQKTASIRGTVTLAANPNAGEQAKQFRHLSGLKPATPVRAFMRTVPSPTSLHLSLPASARGIAITDSAGPFLTPLGSPIWIDSFDVIQLTPVTRHSTDLLGLFPIDTARSTARKIVLKAGSVWFQAHLLAANSPNNSFAGFRIKGGTLTLTEDAARAGGGLDLSPTTIATLIVDLDPPASTPVASGPGVDAGAAAVTLPASVTIQFDPAGGKLTALSDSQLSVYGQAVGFQWVGAASAFEDTTNEIATPLSFSPNQFQVGGTQSKLLMLSGTGPIQAASWVLPVVVTTPSNLGEAAGAGALMLTIGAGVAQQWAGLSQPAILNQTLLHLIPGQIVALAKGSGIQVSETFDLWQGSTVDFAAARPFNSFYLSQAGLEWFEVNGTSVAHLDRPLRADDSRFALKIVDGVLLIFQTATQFFVFIGTVLNTDPKGTNAIALENALIVVDRPSAMAIFGELNPADLNSVWSGLVGLEFGLRGWLPTLPDPYASNFVAADFSSSGKTPIGILTAVVTLKTPDSPTLAFGLLLSSATGMSGLLIVERQKLSLLDLSTNADLFGVEFLPSRNTTISVDQMALALPGSGLAVFTVPQISWEPMKSQPPVAGLHSDNDGGPSAFSVETVNLVRIEPAAALHSLVDEVGGGANFKGHFTLPFGLVANVQAGQFPQSGGTFQLTQPAFKNLSGGLQLTLGAPHPEVEDASLPGTCEATNPYGNAVLSNDVAIMFNDEFLTGTINIQPPPPPRVPVKRIDFSGYGASMFSDWRDSKTEVGIVKAQFDVVVGRTAYEVVKAQSNLYPWAARVVRTITIERQGAGWIQRADSGWQASTEGLFIFPAKEQPDYAGHVHPGAVLGVTNIRNIREVTGGLITAFGLEYQQVLFDADVVLDSAFHVTKGAHVEAGRQLVPSRDVGGYVQLTPGDGASRQQLAELLKKTGPVGGPVACVGNVGGPGGPQLTAVSMDASINKTGPDAELVAALRGSLALPKEGAWTIAKQVGAGVPAALDPKFHLPLIKNDNLDPSKWHFADPADIAQITSPSIAYGLVQATGTQKMFFAQPFVDQTAPAKFNLPAAPHFADVGALLNATGLFPDLGAALPFNTIPSLGVSGSDISFNPAPFQIIGQPPKSLVDFGAVKVLLDYSDGGKIDPPTGNRGVPIPSTLEVKVTPGGNPTWSMSLDPINLILVTPFGDQNDPILRLVGGAKADSNSAPTLTSLDVQYGGALSLVQQVFSKLEEIASFLPGGSAANLQVNFSNGRLTIQDVFALPELPLGFGYVTDVSLILGAGIQLSPQSLDFAAGIGSEQKPFHWLVSPLSGTGVVQVGVRNGDLAILIEAGLGVGLAIDLAIASGSASVVIAIQINNEVSPFQIKAILTGQASVDVLDGLASASITLSAALGITPDKLPIPDALTLYAGVSVGIHLSACWLVSVDFDGTWGFSETFQKPGILPI